MLCQQTEAEYRKHFESKNICFDRVKHDPFELFIEHLLH